MSGVSAALEAARLGRRVVIVDAAPALGGQAVGSIIGTIIGLSRTANALIRITHGIADGMIADLTAEGSMHRRQVGHRHRHLSLRRGAAGPLGRAQGAGGRRPIDRRRRAD
jgi:glycine/D-amino acid oxidase-like deaminating enzyme